MIRAIQSPNVNSFTRRLIEEQLESARLQRTALRYYGSLVDEKLFRSPPGDRMEDYERPYTPEPSPKEEEKYPTGKILAISDQWLMEREAQARHRERDAWYKQQLEMREQLERGAKPDAATGAAPIETFRIEIPVAPEKKRVALPQKVSPRKRCPVCDREGVPPGLSRHPRCERASRQPGAEPPTATPEKVPAPRPQPKRPQEPDPAKPKTYRSLTEATERREAATRGQRTTTASGRPVRIPQARAAVLIRSRGRCENPECLGHSDELTDNGEPILEIDHVEDLATGGRDHPSQMVALCPNCHALKTRGRSRERLRRILADVARQAHQNELVT